MEVSETLVEVDAVSPPNDESRATEPSEPFASLDGADDFDDGAGLDDESFDETDVESDSDAASDDDADDPEAAAYEDSDFGNTPAGDARPGESSAPVRRSAALPFAIEAARLIADDRCEDVLLLDTRRLSPVTDYIVIGTGTSDRQMRSVLQHVEDLGKVHGHRAYGVNADERSTWLLTDFVDVTVHLFEPNTRAHYDLESLWGDAPRVEWRRDGAPTPTGARG